MEPRQLLLRRTSFVLHGAGGGGGGGTLVNGDCGAWLSLTSSSSFLGRLNSLTVASMLSSAPSSCLLSHDLEGILLLRPSPELEVEIKDMCSGLKGYHPSA